MKPINRDDVDMEVAAEIEKQFAELYHGYKVVFAGDSSDPEVLQRREKLTAALKEQAESSILHGTCIDCGKRMPDYEPERDGWQPPDDWSLFREMGTEEPMGWQCKECGEKESDGIPREICLP
jgi:hypothetical protein